MTSYRLAVAAPRSGGGWTVDGGSAIQFSLFNFHSSICPSPRHLPPATLHRRRAAPQREIGIRTANSDAFTILEILGVLLLLSILITMLVSVVGVVQRKAQQDRAQADANALVQAVLHYQQVYGAWPGETNRTTAGMLVAGASDSIPFFNIVNLQPFDTGQSNVIAALAPTPNNSLNPRGLLFLTVPATALRSDGCLVDPWGHPYLLFMDTEHTNFHFGTISFSNLPAFAISAGAPAANPSPSSNWIFSAGVKP